MSDATPPPPGRRVEGGRAPVNRVRIEEGQRGASPVPAASPTPPPTGKPTGGAGSSSGNNSTSSNG